MTRLRQILFRLQPFFRRRKIEAQMSDEIRTHLEMQTEANIAAGMSPEEAHCAARREFGSVDQVKESYRDERGIPWIEDLLRDVRYAVRQLAKSPGFTAVAVLSLALGIGVNTAVFSLVNGILLSSLPVPNPQELRTIQWSGTDIRGLNFTGHVSSPSGSGSGTMTISSNPRERMSIDSFTYPLYRSLREQGAAQADIFAFTELDGINARARREPFIAGGLMVSDNFFSALRVRPVIGRLFAAGDDRAGTVPIAVITYGWWEKYFDLDPGVIGQTASLNGSVFTIVGVLPREFRGLELADLRDFYVPMSAQPLLMANWPTISCDRWWVHLMARVRPASHELGRESVGATQLQTALDVSFAPRVEKTMKAPKVEIGDGRAGLTYDQLNYRKSLLLLLSVVGIVILVACANLAGLSLARSTARQHEFAVRAALGSGRWRLIRQSLTESLVLALLGGGLGILVALWGKTAISQLLAGSSGGLRYDLALDLTVLAFTFGLSLAAALLAGLLPALRAGRVDPVAGLKSRTALGNPRLRAGRFLVAAQIALSVLMLAGAGLYVRTLVNLVRVNPGFATENLLLFELSPRAAGLRGAAATAFYERAQGSLDRIPGVRTVALTQYKLLAGFASLGNFFSLPAHPELRGGKSPSAHRLDVSESFFATMEIPLILGRGFTSSDTDGSPKVVVVNQTFVRKYFTDENPIGQTLKVGDDEWRIAGVCRDAKYADIKADAPPTVYFSYRQSAMETAYFAVRTALPALTLVPAARKAVAAIDPNVPLADVTTQEAVRNSQISQERMFATLVGALAGLAVLLACIGLYGLMAYNVTRRTGEFGVRMALGATSHDIAWPIVREALLLVGAGLAVGVPSALALAHVVENQLYGVAPHDPMTFVAGAVLLLTLALVACWLPARRATKVNPLEALRAD
jgi:predicted permease